MNPKRKKHGAWLVLMFAVGCADALISRESGSDETRPDRLYAMQLAERGGKAPEAERPGEETARIRARIAEERKAWDASASKGEMKFPFYDFTSSPANRKKLEGKDFGAHFTRPFTVDDALVAAVLHSPKLAASREAWRAKIDRLDEVARLDLIVREYAAFVRDLRLRAGKPVGKEKVAKAFPAPGMLELARAVVEKEILMARQNYRITARDLIRDVRHAAAELTHVDTSIVVTGEILSLMKAFEAIVRIMNEGGKARQSSLLRVQIEVAKLENRMRTLEEERRTASARLASLLGIGGTVKIATLKDAPLPPLPPDAESVQSLALNRRQELASLEWRVEKLTILLELAETKTFPLHTLGLGYFERGMGTKEGGGKPMPPFRARPKVDPKAWAATTQAHLDEVRDLLSAARKDLETGKLTTRFRVQRAYARLETALRGEVLYRKTLVARANQAYEAVLAGYRVGRAGFNDVTDAQRTLLKFRLEASASRRDARKAWADLVSEVGADPGK
ncbi:MAG: TolC family protein [Planctomycetota bacterium]|jgi:hypothetical protein